jgi:tRNA adenylyltransferase
MATELRELLESPDTLTLLEDMSEAEKHGLEPLLNQLHMPHIKNSSKDTWEHSFTVLEQGIRIAAERVTPATVVLKTALLFHDIGKPLTYKREGGKVSFHKHDLVGARIIQPVLKKHGYTKREIREISTLIRFHMRSHIYKNGVTTDRAVRRLMATVAEQAGTTTKTVDGVPTFEKLLILFKADLTSKNKRLRNRILNGLKDLEAHANNIVEKDNRESLRPAVNGYEVMEYFNIPPGQLLGQVMKCLNTDEGVRLSRDEALELAGTIIQQHHE